MRLVPNAVEISGLNKTYRSALPWNREVVHAVRDLSLSIPQGEIFGLLGPNGAGKTTTIKMLARLVLPDSGTIAFPTTRQHPRIGAVLEGSRNLYWRLSAWENIHYFGELKGIGLQRIRTQAEELLTLFGLWERRHKPAQTLSRGMQQKLAVVLAFMGDPELLLLDEPTLGLDVASSLAIQHLLKELRQTRGVTIVITTHQMDVAQALCRRVGIMREGAVAVCETIENLVDLFKRQDYIAILSQSAWLSLEPALQAAEGWQYELLPADRPEQAVVRFMLPTAREIYPLMDILRAHGVELRGFRQELPTLEDIFLNVTGTRRDGGGS